MEIWGYLITAMVILLWTLPFAIPLAFFAYAMHKRRFSIAALLWLTAVEAVAISLSLWLPMELAYYLE